MPWRGLAWRYPLATVPRCVARRACRWHPQHDGHTMVVAMDEYLYSLHSVQRRLLLGVGLDGMERSGLG